MTRPRGTRDDRTGAIEIARDRNHTRNLIDGELVDLFAGAGLSDIRYVEESFKLDFDEWFDRGTPSDTKASVRSRLLSGPLIRSFQPYVSDDGLIRIDCFRAILRCSKQGEASHPPGEHRAKDVHPLLALASD